ncbi:MAG TPA: hypothetical protein VK196_12605 [Magnetospirillum sp.]|nr:hypothetical protein [Magnetospirillum sp.]
MKKPVLLALLIGATVAGAYVLLRPAPDKAMAFTGTYADDWTANCGKLQGAAQSKCTARLDAAYGRAAGSPLPANR